MTIGTDVLVNLTFTGADGDANPITADNGTFHIFNGTGPDGTFQGLGLDISGSGFASTTHTTLGADSSGDYRVFATFDREATGSGDYGISLRHVPNASGSFDGYAMGFDSGTAFIYRVSGGTFTTLASTSVGIDVPLDSRGAEGPVEFTLDTNGANVDLAIRQDGSDLLTATDTTPLPNTDNIGFYAQQANRPVLKTLEVQGTALAAGPTLTNGQANSITSSSVTPSVTTDTGNGTAYARVYASGATPTAAQIIAGTGVTPVASAASIAVGATGAINFAAITGLTDSTDYVLGFAQEDSSSNDSNAVLVAFTTASVTRQLVLNGANGREFRDRTGALVDVTGVSYEWYDSPTSTNGNPTDTGTFNIVSGEATITLSNSTNANGAFGRLLLQDPSSDDTKPSYRIPVTVV